MLDLNSVPIRQRPVVERLFQILDDGIAVASAIADNAMEDKSSALPSCVEYELTSKVSRLSSTIWESGILYTTIQNLK